ncbi:hypothetical protein K8R04_00310 [Candidatus Uhrbacteria bacterium]|nr:hypothetical protein [Candidatus Uhrbacteria bacterium]
MLKRWLALVTILVGMIPAGLVLAENASSPNFQNTDSSIIPLIINTVSANFIIDGSVSPIVGTAASANLIVESGPQSDPGNPPVVIPPVIPPPSGGGGGGGGIPIPVPVPSGPLLEPPPTIDPRRWTYKSTAMVQGNRGVTNAEIYLNGSNVDIVYPNADRWSRVLPLGLGDNTLVLQSKQGDRASILVYGMVHRRLIGDVNDNRIVDDVDLSLFTRHWKAFDIQSDFDEDGLIDDVDLSLLASHWGKSY